MVEPTPDQIGNAASDGKWTRIYLAVLIVHALLIVLFAALTNHYQ